MRDIRFRVWYKPTKQMIIDDWEWFLEGLDDERYNIMQFTGLQDKNGKDIYEGDIVAWKTDYALSKPDCKSVVEIKVVNLGTLQSIPAINATTEVIGNIYESPELLENKS